MCLSPITIKNKKIYFKYGFDAPELQVNCCQCPECLAKHQNDLILRAYFQYKDTINSGGYVLFPTLTYAPGCLPHIEIKSSGRKIPAFSYFHIRRFMKLVRNNDNDKDIKYIICSEFGKRKGRPHYHALIFCPAHIKREVMYERILRSWQYGMVSYSIDGAYITNLKGIFYTMKYVSKDMNFYRSDKDLWNINCNSDLKKHFHHYLPRTYMSKGFGLGIKNYIDAQPLQKQYELLLHGMYIPNSDYNKKFSIPDYIRNKYIYVDRVDTDNHVIRIISPYGLNFKRYVIEDFIKMSTDLLSEQISDIRSLCDSYDVEVLNMMINRINSTNIEFELALVKLIYRFRSINTNLPDYLLSSPLDKQTAIDYYLNYLQFDVDNWNKYFQDKMDLVWDAHPVLAPYCQLLRYIESHHATFRSLKWQKLKEEEDKQVYLRLLRYR